MKVEKKYPVPDYFRTNTILNKEEYETKYLYSISNTDEFWAEQATENLDWYKKWTTVSDCDFKTADIKWFVDGKLNVSYNCIDRHLATRANQIAIIWEGNNPDKCENITYQQLHDRVCQLANAMKELGIRKGDRVCIYMPMIPEAVFSMLACTRIGAIHSVVFGGFSPEALRGRINDAECKLVITADEGVRGSMIRTGFIGDSFI